MIQSTLLLKELKRLVSVLEDDIRERLDTQPALARSLETEWGEARQAKRTAATIHEWREEEITQAAVHWILACVFLRFLEDNSYLEWPFLYGASAAAQALARDRHERYFRERPGESDREYLLACFAEAARLPGLSGLYDPRHNPLFRLGISGDGAMQLLEFWQRIDVDTGVLLRDFTDSECSTRFLGDLYQNLSESARERYALLQTPVFVEEFILDRTLTPAIETFGYRAVRLIDPTSGSGHFLLGAFHRLFNLWASKEPTRNLPDLAQQALNAVYGVDLNPFAVEIARFRLLIAALRACDIRKLKDAPDFRINVAAGDSLLHGPRFGLRGTAGMFEGKEHYTGTGLSHAYESEDLPQLQQILGQQYHAVVGNPPYITPKDAALREMYRERYLSCYRKYSLAAPFAERFFDLAIHGENGSLAGYIGMITANSFMKREFGKRLVEEFLPTVDLTHVIDTSGAYIPGHGTPTVILFGRARHPVSESIRTVMGIKGESATPSDPAQGQVWRAIVAQVDEVGSESAFVTVSSRPRADFAQHPWSLGGGGATELQELVERADGPTIGSLAESIGFDCIVSEDDAFCVTYDVRRSVDSSHVRKLTIGDDVRDWAAVPKAEIVFPYDDSITLLPIKEFERALWWARSTLLARKDFGDRTYLAAGRPWWGFHQIPRERNQRRFGIAFPEVATHNHFVLDRGGKLFKHSAPVIKLKSDVREEKHLGILGLLNSSVACFWLKQVCTPKGGDYVGQEGARVRKTLWDERYAFNSTNVAEFPLTSDRPIELSTRLDDLATELSRLNPKSLLADGPTTREALDVNRRRGIAVRRQMIALQEELDWRCYQLYGLTIESLEHPNSPEINLGERAFEIVLARRMARSEGETTWFERHGSTPITDLPKHWPADYRAIVEKRIALIESDRHVGLIERPEYKRRWNAESWEEQEQRALREWLLDRLETERYWPRSGALKLRSAFQLADIARTDAEFMQVAAVYKERDDFDVTRLLSELTDSEAVPYLAALRYTDDGMRKRAAWEQTWILQRQEDVIDAQVAANTRRRDGESEGEYAKRLVAARRKVRLQEIGEVPVPPKYKSSDFRKADYWARRGALDAPKERFIGFPLASPAADSSLMLAWAGWDHLQLCQAVAAHYLVLKEREAWDAQNLMPLLAGILERVPWLKQWYNELDPALGARMGDYYEGFVQDEARNLGLTLDDLRNWRPPATATRRRRAAAGQ